MTYSKKKIGEELKKEIDEGFDISRISNWAYDLLYIKIRDRPNPEISSILRNISLMDAGPEFEYTYDELQSLAELLLKNEEDPIKKLNERKSQDVN